MERCYHDYIGIHLLQNYTFLSCAISVELFIGVLPSTCRHCCVCVRAVSLDMARTSKAELGLGQSLSECSAEEASTNDVDQG